LNDFIAPTSEDFSNDLNQYDFDSKTALLFSIPNPALKQAFIEVKKSLKLEISVGLSSRLMAFPEVKTTSFH